MTITPDQTSSSSRSNALLPRSRSISVVCKRDVAGANAQIANKLRQAADILTVQGAGPFRIGAYSKAAESIRRLDADLEAIAEQGGRSALEAIPGIGISIGSAIAEMLATGRWGFLDHLKGTARPETLFRSVPGVGPALTRQICETLHLHTLEGLEAAAHDGRLEQVRGFGHRRVAMVRAALAEMLAQVRRIPLVHYEEPEVELLLDVDREYREKATSGELVKIAPKRFNPEGKAWLPLLHTMRDGWHFTALYSNTARAHRLGREADWVIIYYHKDNRAEGQRTVVTEMRGEATGKRIVRGREAECQRHYAAI